MSRRTWAIAAAALTMASACASKTGSINVTTIAISEPTSRDGDQQIAGDAVTRFGNDLFNALRGDHNAVISPLSVAIAFAMLEPGTTGAGKTALDAALHIEDAAKFHAAMTELRRSLEAAEPPPKEGDHDPGDLEIAIGNATYVQDGYALTPAYLDALGKYYGPVLRTVDFAAHGDDAVTDINKFIAEHTRGHIKKVLDSVSDDTLMALVNALYLKASWSEPFDEDDTKPEPFTRLDGSKVITPLMHASSDTSVGGDGWVAARKMYSGRLAADFVLPDSGRFDDIAGRLGAIFPELNADHQPGLGSTLVVPKLTTRLTEELRPALEKLGLGPLYEPGNLIGIADDERLVLDQALHATWLAMDEKGTEAAAATVLTVRAVSAPIIVKPPVPVILDRPYFFRIVDGQSGATLFIGQVLDPTAG